MSVYILGKLDQIDFSIRRVLDAPDGAELGKKCMCFTQQSSASKIYFEAIWHLADSVMYWNPTGKRTKKRF